MSRSVGVVSESFLVGAGGRVVLPAAVRRAAHIEEGAEVVARLIGEGQLLIETKDAVRPSESVTATRERPVDPALTSAALGYRQGLPAGGNDGPWSTTEDGRRTWKARSRCTVPYEDAWAGKREGAAGEPG
jgi:bifunctional DNA-binding transcriptional regulator/antitoxin component of YhaV-PrlF toxin-antitoxin module